MIEWELEAVELVSCNCDWGCPCQFNALPTHGNCQAIACLEIKKGHYGDTSLDGLRLVTIMEWPKAIHEGNGKVQAIVDERADEAQRAAILSIISGEETEPGATIWNVFSATFTEAFEPLFKAIDFDVDVDGRTGKIVVEGMVDVIGEPIRNPVTGKVHRARIDLPNGFEYSLAEMGNTNSTSSGKIPLSFTDSYGQFARLHLNNQGIVSAA